LATLAGIALNSQQPSAPRVIQPTLPPAINSFPDPRDQLEMRQEQNKKQNFEAANAERKKQIADDSVRLLKLAADLKAEVDKTTKDMLSLKVIRRADEIEKLAHDVKEKMKLSVEGN
jgi:DNA-binding transcriptional regulator WhiA